MTATITQTVRSRASVPAPSTAEAAANGSRVTIRKNGRLVTRAPTAVPAFTLSQIRAAIPPHCFEKPFLTSFSYILYDLAIVSVLFYCSTLIPAMSSNFFSFLTPIIVPCLWICYWVAQGAVMTGLWVIGHECGHGGFHKLPIVNDVVGFVLHSALLVPYFSWQISHRKHHSNTGCIERDEVFVPRISTEAKAEESEEASDLSITFTLEAIYRFIRIAIMLTLGWPLYLLFNATGNASYPKSFNLNHFIPTSPIYADISNGRQLVILSDLGMLAAFAALWYLSTVFTFTNVVFYYGIPYLVTNLFLVLITFLQHTDHSLPHYTANSWDWLRGALTTVDRDYGILNSVFHHITDTHVVHHLFSSMPHYHAQEATDAVKPLLGDYYLYDSTPIWKACWISYGECSTVKEDKQRKGVYWY